MRADRIITLGLILSASAIRGLGQWLLIFILIRVSGPESVGSYGLATAIVVPFASFTGLQLREVLATERPDAGNLGAYVSVRYVATILNVLVLLPLAWRVTEGQWGVAIALLVLSTSMDLVDLFNAHLLQQSLLRAYGVSSSVAQFLGWSAAIVTLLITHRLEYALVAAGLALFAGFKVTQFTPWVPRQAKYKLALAGTLPIVRTSFPLGLAVGADLLSAHLPRIVLDHYFGPYELGILVGLLAVLSAGMLFIDAFAQALTPRVARLIHSGSSHGIKTFVVATYSTTLFAALLVSLASYWIGPPVSGLVLGPDYDGYPLETVGIVVIVFLQLINRIASIALNSARALTPLMWINFGALAIVVLVSFLVIPELAVAGAVIALVSGHATRTLFLYGFVRRLY